MITCVSVRLNGSENVHLCRLGVACRTTRELAIIYIYIYIYREREIDRYIHR